VSSIVTDYLNDVQPGLVKLLRQDDGTNTEHFVHALRGIHAVDDGTDWNFYAQDGLGSVRAMVDNIAVVQSSMSFNPYGNPQGSYGDGYLYAGEQVGSNGLSYNRNRYYSPAFSTWLSLDPLETPNRYAYVSGNPINMVDPSGLQDDVVTTIIPELLERLRASGYVDISQLPPAFQQAFQEIARNGSATTTAASVAGSPFVATSPFEYIVPRVIGPLGTAARFGAVGTIISANLTTVQGDYAGTAYDFAFGTATNISQFQNAPASPLFDNGTECLIGMPTIDSR
jgi:RHS repeat-associated protein